MSIQLTRNGDIELAYEVEGPTDGVPLLLVSAGAGTQMAMWPKGIRTGLVERGFRVAMMDQRDDGLSTHLTGKPAYTLRDMTDDTVAVLDALGWPKAVLVGASLGGMLAQAVAIEHPDRAAGLVSMLSTSATSLWINRPKIWTILRLIKAMSGTSADREAEGQRWVDAFRIFATKGYPSDDDHWREAGRLVFDRGRNPVGSIRHTAAIRAAGDRGAALGKLEIPALVVHGSRDQLVSPRAARATADAIPGARFLLIPGMGHQLARSTWPKVLDEIGTMFAGSTDKAQLSG
ncbi:MAG TPA: alpha/beta hydrolase [Pseudonocardiaceae bacterium]|nr:alpha/beta hydrolase [Pseudonocardiaceae bacterium]